MPSEDLLPVYCTRNYLDAIKKNSYKASATSGQLLTTKIIEITADIYTDISDEQLKNLSNSDPFYKKLNKRENLNLRSASKWCGFEKYDYDNISDEVLILPENSQLAAQQIRDKKGGLIFLENEDMKLVDKISKKNGDFVLAPHNKRNFLNVKKDSWRDVFIESGNSIVKPINAMVITDNFMFSTMLKFSQRKEDSLFSILRALVPADLEIPFHLTIFTCNSNQVNNYLAESDAIELIEEIKSLNLCNEINISIIGHGNKQLTHDRHIFTNYHIINCGTGFSIIDSDGIQEIGIGAAPSVFHNIDNCSSKILTKKHVHRQVLSWLNEIYEKLEHTSTFYIVGDGVKNRLLR